LYGNRKNVSSGEQKIRRFSVKKVQNYKKDREIKGQNDLQKFQNSGNNPGIAGSYW